MASRRRRALTRVRTVTRRAGGRARSYTRRRGRVDIKRAAKGALAGLAVAVPMGILARRTGNSMLFEVGERAGAVAASYFGGTWGQVAFQGIDAAAERYIPRLEAGGSGVAQIGGQFV